jgi:hypothetical protein
MVLGATYTDVYNVTERLDSINFTVIKLTFSVKAGNTDQPSGDNSIGSNYQNATGRQTLGGPFFNTATYQPFQLPFQWRHAIEIKGAVSPSDFDQTLTLQRVFNSRIYTGSDPGNTLAKNFAGCQDRSNDFFLDKNPAPNGAVYDIDGPGLDFANGSFGVIARSRTNYTQWVSVNQANGGTSAADVRVSNNFQWFDTLSVIQNSDGSKSVNTDVLGDNQIGSGTTSLAWDLGTTPININFDPCP